MLGKWVNKAKGSESSQDKELSESEWSDLERVHKENTALRMERDRHRDRLVLPQGGWVTPLPSTYGT
jgi:regulator of replication initiation timing